MQLQNRLVPVAAVKQMTAKIEGLEDDLHRIVQVGPVGGFHALQVSCTLCMLLWLVQLSRGPSGFLRGHASPGGLRAPGGVQQVLWTLMACGSLCVAAVCASVDELQVSIGLGVQVACSVEGARFGCIRHLQAAMPVAFRYH